MIHMLVGFSGNKGAGKTFCADYLCEKHDFFKLSFSYPLKEACRAIFGFDDEQLYGDNDSRKTKIDPHWKITPRWALQRLGTECMRERFGPLAVEAGLWSKEEAGNLWLRAIHRKIMEESHRGHARFVIDDVRFLNEFDYVHQHGGVMAQINRDTVEQFDLHQSEQDLTSLSPNAWDYHLANDAMIFTQLDHLAFQLMHRPVPSTHGPLFHETPTD